VNLLTPPFAGAMAVLGLLVAFTVVVRDAVRQGDTRRGAAALRVEATWRCQALRAPNQRERCLLLVRQQAPVDSAGLHALLITAGAWAPAAAAPTR
jgi:hypothetical protein